MPYVFDRQARRAYLGETPTTGTYGQMSLGRLCDLLESAGEVSDNERITHLEIAGDIMQFRVEPKEP